MEKFVQTVPIPYYGNHGMRPKTDCFALVSNVAAKKCESLIFAVDTLKIKIKHSSDRNNLKNVKVKNFSSVFRMILELIKEKPTTVFGNDRTSAGFVAAFFGKYRLFMSHQSMNPPQYWKKLIFKFFIKKFDAIKVSNPYEVDELLKLGVEKERIFYIPIPIDHAFFGKTPKLNSITRTKNNIGLKPEEKFILSVSHIRSQKKAYTVINAFKLLKEKYPDLKLVLTGKDMLRDEGLPSVKEKAEELKVENSVIVTGRVAEEDLACLMHSAEVGIISSEREGQCLTAYEKAAAGLPLCLSNIGSFTSVFGGSALFHEPDDYRTLASNIDIYLSNPEIVRRFSEKNKKIVIRLTDYDKIWKKMEDLLFNKRKKLQRKRLIF